MSVVFIHHFFIFDISYIHFLCYVGKALFKSEQDRGITWKEVED
jgi:hypothetical protein